MPDFGVIVVVALVIGALVIFGFALQRDVKRINRERGTFWPGYMNVRYPRLQAIYVGFGVVWVIAIVTAVIFTHSLNGIAYMFPFIFLFAGSNNLATSFLEARDARREGQKASWYAQPKFWVGLGFLVCLPAEIILLVSNPVLSQAHSEQTGSEVVFPVIISRCRVVRYRMDIALA